LLEGGKGAAWEEIPDPEESAGNGDIPGRSSGQPLMVEEGENRQPRGKVVRLPSPAIFRQQKEGEKH